MRRLPPRFAPTTLAVRQIPDCAQMEVVIARLDEGAEALRAMWEWLCDAERQRALRLRFERDRRRFVVARARLRALLAERLGTRPQALELARAAGGKPQLAPRLAASGWRFNVSHCEELVLYAFSRDREVGVDLEAIRPVAEADAIAARFFAPAERCAYFALASRRAAARLSALLDAQGGPGQGARRGTFAAARAARRLGRPGRLAPRELFSAAGLHRGARYPAMNMTASTYESPWMNDDVRMFRRTVRQFIQKEFVPHQARWREQRGPDAEAWTGAGAPGCCSPTCPRNTAAAAARFAHEAVVLEELARAGVHFGSSHPEHRGALHPRLRQRGAEAQVAAAHGARRARRRHRHDRARRRLRPAGDQDHARAATATTTSSTARRPSSPTARTPSLVCLAVKTDPKVAGMRGISLVMVETDGPCRATASARPLEKIGMHGQDTCELFFDDGARPGRESAGRAPRAGASRR